LQKASYNSGKVKKSTKKFLVKQKKGVETGVTNGFGIQEKKRL
jgi:hypothetical protein